MKEVHILGLEDYGLTLEDLHQLGSRSVSVTVSLSGPKVQSLFSMPARKRLEITREVLGSQFERVKQNWPADDIRIRGEKKLPWTFDSVICASDIQHLIRMPEIKTLYINELEGGKRRQERKSLSWFGVRASVAIQVEGQIRGLQEVEDRIMIVKAYSAGDAMSRLGKVFEKYAEPYLNSQGEMVRWQLEKFVDTYLITEGTLDHRGTEVFSTMWRRRMRPEYEWHPLQTDSEE